MKRVTCASCGIEDNENMMAKLPSGKYVCYACIADDEGLKEKEHNLDGWTPGIEMSAPGIKYTINLKKEQPGIVRDILKR